MPEQRKWGVCHFFHKIGCHGNVPRDIGKTDPDRLSAPKTLSFGEKIAKIGPADPEIICLREIIKKDKETEKRNKPENAWQSLAYSPLGAVVSPQANTCEKHLLTDHLSA